MHTNPEEAVMRGRQSSVSVRTALVLMTLFTTALVATPQAHAQPQKPNIILILSDDFGYGDSGPYGGGPGRGMATPSIDQMADQGMTFFSFYAQPSCTPGVCSGTDRADSQSQRHDDRGLPGPGRGAAGRGVDARVGTEAGGLPDVLHRQVAPGRGRLRAAQRPWLRRDEVRRALPPQRLHVRRSDLVPRHASGAAGPVPAGDQGSPGRQRRATGP
jgi:Sulfatase